MGPRRPPDVLRRTVTAMAPPFLRGVAQAWQCVMAGPMQTKAQRAAAQSRHTVRLWLCQANYYVTAYRPTRVALLRTGPGIDLG